MNSFRGFVFVFVIGVLLLTSQAAFADVQVQNCQGTLIITDPNATDPDRLVTMVDCGADIPPIPDGAILEIFDGQFTVIVSGESKVNVIVLDHEFTLDEGDTVNIQSGEDEGLVEAVKGSIIITDPAGKEIPLKEGPDNRYPIKLSPLDPTEALENAETDPLETDPPVDSRSLDASPTT